MTVFELIQQLQKAGEENAGFLDKEVMCPAEDVDDSAVVNGFAEASCWIYLTTDCPAAEGDDDDWVAFDEGEE